MIRLFYKSFKDCMEDLKKYASFELFCVLFTSFIWVPFLTYIYKLTLRWMGSPSLLNNEVYNIAKNYKGIAGIMLIFVLCIIIIFIEIGVLIVLAHKNYFDKEIGIFDSFVYVIKRLPKFFRLGIFQLIPFLLITILTINLPLLNVITGKINLPIFIASKLKNNTMILVYGIAIIILIYVLLRSIFTTHYILIEGQNVSKAIISSVKLTKHKKVIILIFLIMFNGIILIFGGSIMYSITYIIKNTIGNIQNHMLTNYFTTLSSYLTYLLIILIMPFNIIFITNLYYYFSSTVKKPVDEITVKNYVWPEKLEKKIGIFIEGKKYLVILLVIAYLTITFLLNYTVMEQIFNWKIIVAAHRGYHLAPENSLTGIKEALLKGADAVEIDVQMTKDGVLVLNHDTTLYRVAGRREKISELKYEVVRKIDIGTRLGYYGVTIPSLESALELIQSMGSNVILDLKPEGNIDEMVEKTVFLVESKDMIQNTYVQSFDTNILAKFRKFNPKIKLGQVLYAATGNISKIDVDFYTIHQYMLSDSFMVNSKKQGRGVWVWTVNLDRSIREVLKYRVEGIISDYPEKVREIMAQ